MFTERTGLIVWLNDLKMAKNLERFGTIHYISKKMLYAVLYINAEQEQTVREQIEKYPFVKKIEKSFRNEIRTEYNSNIPDKSRFYTI